MFSRNGHGRGLASGWRRYGPDAKAADEEKGTGGHGEPCRRVESSEAKDDAID